MNIDWQIPPSINHWLEVAPVDQPVVLLLRHSVREDLPPGDAGYILPITETGVLLAQQLGKKIGQRLKSLHTSPLLRCVQTADALQTGAGMQIPINKDNHLGDPGVFVLDGKLAQTNWDSLGHEKVMHHLVNSTHALPGMARPEQAARFLVHHMLAVAGGIPGLHIFVTHDSLVTATAARLLGESLGPDEWPWYLEGSFFWRSDEGIHTAYRNSHSADNQDVLCGLGETDIIEFARREIAQTVGLNSDARFLLAGGAFKSIITGHATRDLDIWAPSKEDRYHLIRTLESRGTKRLGNRPFAEAFSIAGRVVEIPIKTEPSTLEARLARFDIALSAVGVEHRPNDQWSAIIHPLAISSVEKREILLLKPLVNWKYALSTLERMRRYASELGFVVPLQEEAEIWRVYDEQSQEMKIGMIERFKNTCIGGFDVEEDTECR